MSSGRAHAVFGLWLVAGLVAVLVLSSCGMVFREDAHSTNTTLPPDLGPLAAGPVESTAPRPVPTTVYVPPPIPQRVGRNRADDKACALGADIGDLIGGRGRYAAIADFRLFGQAVTAESMQLRDVVPAFLKPDADALVQQFTVVKAQLDRALTHADQAAVFAEFVSHGFLSSVPVTRINAWLQSNCVQPTT